MKETFNSPKHNNATVTKEKNEIILQKTAEKRKSENYDAFETKRGHNESMIASNFGNYEHTDSGIQNVIVIRSSRHEKREPDRYIRIPITS
jgi:hypothetical protein